MKKLLIAFLAIGLTLGFGLVQDGAQDDTKQDHSEHSEKQTHEGEVDHSDPKEDGEMGHDDDSHGDMDHSEHNEMSDMEQALNVVLVGEASLTLEPLINADGMLTLGVKVEPPADLALSVTSPSGEEITLSAVPVMAAEEDHEDMKEDHDGEKAEGEYDMDSTHADVASTLTFQVGAAEEGVWRFSGTLDGADVSFPVSIYKASTDATNVYLALAPSPALSTRGLSEAFVYAFRNGEVVHNGMVLNRSMEGMQHSTDDEQLMLTHNHFGDVYNDTLGYGPMANQQPLGFAMAGEWDVNVMIMGENEEMLGFDVEVLNE